MVLPVLPIEIVNLIADHLDKTALQQTRLVSKVWNVAASKCLFNTISMIPTPQGINKWKAVAADSKIRQLARKIIINSCPVPDWDPFNYSFGSLESALMQDWNPEPDDEEYASFYSAIDDIDMFPNLEHAVLQFTSHCASDDSDIISEIESTEYRLDILQRFFASLEKRTKQASRHAAQALTIYNLQNIPQPDFTTSNVFEHVLSSVQELHVQVCEEANEHGPDNDIFCEQRRTFMPHLKDHWLTPVTNQLRVLTLYLPDHWGPIPGYFDGSGLAFPELHTFTLGGYCLAHQDAFDWILRQDSLRSLRLHSCVIASYFRLDADNVADWNVRTHDWNKVPNERFGLEEYDEDEVYHYAGVWAEVFTSIRNSLHHLVDFRFHFDERRYTSGEQAWFGRPDLLSVQMSPQRYTAFDIGILPSQWLIPESSGGLAIGEASEGVNVHEENLLKDQEALDVLLHELRSRQYQT